MAKFSNKNLLQLSISGSIGTLDFSAYPQFDVRNLYAVIDQTAGVPLYLMGVSGYGYSALANGTILTLQAPMSGSGPPAFAVQATDILAVVYDEVFTAGDLVAMFSGKPQVVTGRPLPYMGAFTSDAKTQDLLAKIYATMVVLCRLTIADKAVTDSDIESLLNDELNNPSA